MADRTEPLIVHLAGKIAARLNCIAANNDYWLRRHTDGIHELIAFLPSGSGIDNGTSISLDRSTTDRIVLMAGFHHMNESGMYDGWTEHTITVRPSFIGQIDLTIAGRNRNAIKEYLHDTYYWALLQPVTHTADGFNLDREVSA